MAANDSSEKKSDIMYEIGIAKSEMNQIKSKIDKLKADKKQYEVLKRGIEEAILHLDRGEQANQTARVQINRSVSGVKSVLILDETDKLIKEIGENKASLKSIIRNVDNKIIKLNNEINVKERALGNVQYKIDKLWNNYAMLN